jgi:hypothetical protein
MQNEKNEPAVSCVKVLKENPIVQSQPSCPSSFVRFSVRCIASVVSCVVISLLVVIIARVALGDSYLVAATDRSCVSFFHEVVYGYYPQDTADLAFRPVTYHDEPL